MSDSDTEGSPLWKVAIFGSTMAGRVWTPIVAWESPSSPPIPLTLNSVTGPAPPATAC